MAGRAWWRLGMADPTDPTDPTDPVVRRHDVNRTQEQVLDDELAGYLRARGLPPYLAAASTWLTRSLHWQRSYTVDAAAAQLSATLVAWFAQLSQGKLVRSMERQGTFEVQGVLVVAGPVVASRSPKLVLALVSMEPDGAGHTHITIETGAKVGHLSGRPTQRVATTACEVVAEEIIQQLSGLASDAR
jgi:hypothetical protein